ncbi:hypothetical protein CBF45_07415 [Bordetella sp. J329]|nr:hypothetical protein CBF45_07415 [Bordetella sp. J329]
MSAQKPDAISEDDWERHEARMDEVNDNHMGIQMAYLHLSALSLTTRRSHAIRHGRIFTAQQAKEFWSDHGNIMGCRCRVVPVMVDDDGKPVVPSIVERARKTYEKMLGRGYGWAMDGDDQ